MITRKKLYARFMIAKKLASKQKSFERRTNDPIERELYLFVASGHPGLAQDTVAKLNSFKDHDTDLHGGRYSWTTVEAHVQPPHHYCKHTGNLWTRYTNKKAVKRTNKKSNNVSLSLFGYDFCLQYLSLLSSVLPFCVVRPLFSSECFHFAWISGTVHPSCG